jgi:small subunit ribosomal protein S9
MKRSGIEAIGRRKSSVARALLKPGEGKITVNDRAFEQFFGRRVLQMIVKQPLVLAGDDGKYDLEINVAGGGPTGQAGAVRLAIARALIKQSPEKKKTLKDAGYLTRDSREVERKKYGRHKARRRPQYSKR